MVIGRVGQSCACAAPQTPSEHAIAAPTIVLTMLSSLQLRALGAPLGRFALSLCCRCPHLSAVVPAKAGTHNHRPREYGSPLARGRQPHELVLPQSALMP